MLSANGWTLFVGTNEPGHPGTIQIYKLPFEKVMEIQAHSLPIVRMKTSFCTNFLFSTGDDGNLIIYEVKDKDPKGRRDKEGMDHSDEILTLESHIEELDNWRKQLMSDHTALMNKDGVGDILALKKKDEELLKI